MQRYNTTVLARGTGLALAGALVTIYETGTVTKASLYETDDVNGPTLANPLTADDYGNVAAYIPDGTYDLRVDHNANPTYTIPEVQVYDLAALTASVSGPLDPELAAIAALTSGSNRLPYFTGSGTAALTDLTNVARQLLDDTTFAAMRTTLGVLSSADIAAAYQPLDADLTAIAALATTAFGRSLLTSADATAARTLIGAGTGNGDLLSTNNLSDVANVATARTNLGLEIGVNVQAYSAELAALASEGFEYIFGFFFTTTPDASETLLIHVAGAPFTIPADFAGGLESEVGTNPTSSFALDVQKNGVTCGTITVGTGGTVTAVTSGSAAQSFVAGDVLTVVAPGSADATAADMAFTIVGDRTP